MREADELIWHMYERDLRSEGKSQATIDGYRWAVGYLSDALPAGADLLSAGRGHIADWLAAVAGRASSTTHATYMRRVRTFYTHMIEAGYHDGPHPMRGIARVNEDKTLLACPEEADIAKVIRACEGKHWRDRRDMAMTRILCEAGTPRASELARLPLEAPDLARDGIRIKGKGGRERWVPLGAKACRALTLWLRARQGLRLAAGPDTRHLLFFSKYGPLDKDSVRKIIAARCRLAGIPEIAPHAFRRFTYDRWDELDGNPGAAMQLWGWDTPTMPHLYGRQNAGRRAVTHARQMSLGDRIA